MAMTRGQKVTMVAGVAVVGVLAAWWLSGRGSVSPAASSGSLPLSAGDMPDSFYNLNFQAPGPSTPATGYAPLYGFIGWGTQWF